MVLADFKGHKDMVTCCTMSASGKIIVSSSEDLTVKVRGLFVGRRRGCAPLVDRTFWWPGERQFFNFIVTKQNGPLPTGVGCPQAEAADRIQETCVWCAVLCHFS